MPAKITKWEQVIGSKNQIKVILNAIKRGVLPHFTLLSGASGIGKSTIAQLIGKTLLCEHPDPVTNLPCYNCSSCLAIDSGSNTSFVKINVPELYKKEDINDQIKDIFKFQKISDRTVYVLEEIHDLKHDLQRPLLEPLTSIPEDVYILSCTTAYYKLLPELISRSFKVELLNPTPNECSSYVVTTAMEYGIELPSQAAIESFAELCDYNPRHIAENLRVVATDNVLTEESLVNIFNLVKDSDIIEFLKAFVQSSDVATMVTQLHQLDSLSLKRLVNKSIEILFQAMLYQQSGVAPDTRKEAMHNFITITLMSVPTTSLAQAMAVLGRMSIKDTQSFPKNMAEFIDGKLKLLGLQNKSLAAISKATSPTLNTQKAFTYTADIEAKDSKKEPLQTSEFVTKPIQNSAQVAKLLMDINGQ